MKLAKLRTIKPKKSWVILGIALSIGLLAALVASSYLNKKMAAIDALAKGATVDVVVAKADMLKGAKLNSESLAVRPVPAEFVPSSAVRPADFARLDGQVLDYPVKPGEMIMWNMVEGKKVPTFSARVGVGRRAMTVPVDEINSISGMLEPGDTIDLIVTMELAGKKNTFPLMQGAVVMATGQRSVDDAKSGERRQYSTVTLDTTPEQAQHVIVARESGKITALLRNPEDKQITNSNINVAALLGIRGDGPQGAQVASGEIPVLYGGGGKLPTEGLVLKKFANGNANVPVIQSNTVQAPPPPSVSPVAIPIAATTTTSPR